MEIKNLDELFSKVELYNDLRFEIYKLGDDGKYHLDKSKLTLLSNILDLSKKSIDSYCVFCENTYSFDVSVSSSITTFEHGITRYIIPLGYSTYIDFYSSECSGFLPLLDVDDLYDFKHTFIRYDFSCNKVRGHNYKMELVVSCAKGVVTIRKIGQFPSMIDIWGFSFDKYKKQLDTYNAYSDFKKAELCMADGLYAGAYTYLRRVFEKMLDYYCKDIELTDKRAETKINSFKHVFDDRIQPLLNNLYKILSKGIHELTDDESETYYSYLRTIIEMQLEHIKEIDDKAKQTKELSKKINEIATFLNE